MILVTTAGRVGAEAARLLADRDIPVRVLVRAPEKHSALARKGVEVVRGDLDDLATIDAALHGVSSVVLVSPAIPAQELALVNAAVRAGVEHVVKITSDSAADSVIARRRGQAQIESALVASGLGYTLLKNNAYMQNFLMLAPEIRNSGGFSASAGDGRIGMVDARDVAEVAAVIANSPAAHRGKTYWPTGPEKLSYADAAEVLSKALDRPVVYTAVTVEQQRLAMIDLGLPDAVAADNARALGLFADGDADYLTEDVPTILGRPARTFERFVADHAAAFM